MEICFNQEWGTVCDQMWDEQDAIVVCRHLGLVSEGVEAVGNATFGQGTGWVWLDNVQCTGNETALINCSASSRGINSCTHGQDAGVRCGKYMYYFMTNQFYLKFAL